MYDDLSPSGHLQNVVEMALQFCFYNHRSTCVGFHSQEEKDGKEQLKNDDKNTSRRQEDPGPGKFEFSFYKTRDSYGKTLDLKKSFQMNDPANAFVLLSKFLHSFSGPCNDDRNTILLSCLCVTLYLGVFSDILELAIHIQLVPVVAPVLSRLACQSHLANLYNCWFPSELSSACLQTRGHCISLHDGACWSDGCDPSQWLFHQSSE
jgi:hypothetical protein